MLVRDFLFPAYSCLCPVSPVTVSRLLSPRDFLQVCDRQDFASMLEGDDNHMNSLQDFVLDGLGSSGIKLYATRIYILIATIMRTQELQISNYSGYVLTVHKILQRQLQSSKFYLL